MRLNRKLFWTLPILAPIALLGILPAGGQGMGGMGGMGMGHGSMGMDRAAPPAGADGPAAVGLPEALESRVMELAPGGLLQLEARPVAKDLAGNRVRMFGFNGQIPGPLLKVKQGSRLPVEFTNRLDLPTTVHWHGIRLENRFDGVPGLTQPPIRPGESYRYELRFPDAGLFWYHPHLREDMTQELGLYGAILVVPEGPPSLAPVDQEVVLFLDDIRTQRGGLEPFSREQVRYTLSGRFGNRFLLNGATDYRLQARPGEVLRFYLINSANTRTFSLSFEGARMKLVGADAGLYGRESFVPQVLLGPAERAVVDVLFEQAGTYRLLQTTPHGSTPLGTVAVAGPPADGRAAAGFFRLQEHPDAELEALRAEAGRAPDVSLALAVEAFGMGGGLGPGMGMMGTAEGGLEPIEWEEDPMMAMMNASSTKANVRWLLRDRSTGRAGPDLLYPVAAGEVRKIRLFNDPSSAHPMQHPIHLHGQRFLVAARNGVEEANPVWKDTALVPAGETVDILVRFSEPGDWLLHCHISEHLEAGMEAAFRVTP